jgi:hypothetical protein
LPLVGAIEKTFQDSWVEIDVPVHAIPAGLDWTALREKLIARSCEALAGMPIADYHDLSRTRFDWPDVPFPIWISRQPRAKGESPKCIIFRQTPDDLPDQLAADVRRALDEKTVQLRAYKDTGHPTVLILDFDDKSLLNRTSVAEAFTRATRGWADASVVDEVFLVDNARQPPWVYPVKIGRQIYPDLPQFRQYFSAQYRANYGSLAD